MDETSLMLHLRPDLVNAAYKSAPRVTGHTLKESFDVTRAADWPGYLGSPRLASAAMGEKIWKSFVAAAIEQAQKILEGTDPAKILRYADLLEKSPLYQDWITAATAREQEIERRQREWVRKRASK
jgi:hypothetical protein